MTISSPGMAGTVKLCVPELGAAAELLEFVGRAEAVAVTEGLAVAECGCDGEVAGVGDVPAGVDDCDAVGVAAKAVAEPPEAAADAAEGVDPLAPHAVRPAPPMTAAMITAGTRHILIFVSSAK